MSLSILTDANLERLNTLAIPVRAHSLARVTSQSDVHDALAHARANELPVLVLGEGSNTVFQDDFTGLVLLNRIAGIDILNDTPDHIDICVGAGENWHHLVQYTLKKGWYGLENLALIPGLVGAAPIQNIGAYGVEVKDSIVEVAYIDQLSGESVILSNQDCQFAYRDSVFKGDLCNLTVITSVTFRLSKIAACKLSYPALKDALEGEPTPAKVFDAVCRLRTAKLPSPDDIPNAGSFFKNPVVAPEQFAMLQQRFPEIVGYPSTGGVKIAAAWLIEFAGWKSKEIDGVSVHRDQALVIVNPKHRSGSAILGLAAAIQKDIAAVFGVELEIEPRVY